MNRLILEPTDFVAEDLVLIQGTRAEHLIGICKLKAGDPVKVGLINGPLGKGEVIDSLSDAIRIRYYPGEKSEASVDLDVTVLLAMPRPQMLKRIFQKAATFGVKRLVLFRSERVEKSYFGSPQLKTEEIRKNLILGLEQGGKTRLPEVEIYRMQNDFRVWRQNQAPANRFLLSLNSKTTILDYSDSELSEVTFLIGPEGGFIPREEERFIEEGFVPLKVANSILRVESAFDFILAQHSLTTMKRFQNG